jgi:hypothetical protein
MQFNEVLTLLNNNEIPVAASLFERYKAFRYIITTVLHIGDVSLHEIFTVVAEGYVEDTIVINRIVLQKL